MKSNDAGKLFKFSLKQHGSAGSKLTGLIIVTTNFLSEYLLEKSIPVSSLQFCIEVYLLGGSLSESISLNYFSKIRKPVDNLSVGFSFDSINIDLSFLKAKLSKNKIYAFKLKLLEKISSYSNILFEIDEILFSSEYGELDWIKLDALHLDHKNTRACKFNKSESEVITYIVSQSKSGGTENILNKKEIEELTKENRLHDKVLYSKPTFTCPSKDNKLKRTLYNYNLKTFYDEKYEMNCQLNKSLLHRYDGKSPFLGNAWHQGPVYVWDSNYKDLI